MTFKYRNDLLHIFKHNHKGFLLRAQDVGEYKSSNLTV